MIDQYFLQTFVEKFLPIGAEIVESKKEYRKKCIEVEDLDGDGIFEIIALYRFNGGCHELILKEQNDIWYKLFDIEYLRNIQLFVASVKKINGVTWGYIDNSGNFKIKPVYKEAKEFQDNGLAIIVNINDLSAVINEKGANVIPLMDRNINSFSEGIAVFSDKKGFSAMNEKGEIITEKYYNYMQDFKNSRAVVSKTLPDGSWNYGYIDKQGNDVIPIKYKMANDFNNGKAVVQETNGSYSIIDFNGNIINSFKYAYVGNLREGLLAFREKSDGKVGFINEKGNVIIPPKFSSAEEFKDGRSVVNATEDYENKYGVIDKTGKILISTQYNDIINLGEGRFAVGIALNKENPFIGSKYAIYDMDGKRLTDFIYYGVSNFQNGIASAYDQKSTFFIDKTGNKTKDLPMVNGSGNLQLKENVIKAYVDMRTFYLDRSGKVIYEQNKEIPLNNIYTVREDKYKPNINYLVYYPQILGISDKKKQAYVNNKLKELSQIKPIDANANLEFSYYGDFNVEFFRKNLVVLNIYGYNFYFGAAHGMPTKIYCHVDLEKGNIYELKDLFKKDSNYAKVLSDIIRKQIVAMGKDSYIWLDQYKGIRENQPFYITKDTLNIYFYPYEIAPYAAGFPIFKIPYKDIMNIIDTEGDFWRSFN